MNEEEPFNLTRDPKEAVGFAIGFPGLSMILVLNPHQSIKHPECRKQNQGDNSQEQESNHLSTSLSILAVTGTVSARFSHLH